MNQVTGYRLQATGRNLTVHDPCWRRDDVLKSRKTQAIYRLLRLLQEGTNHQMWECQRLDGKLEPIAVRGSRWLGFAEYSRIGVMA